MISWKTLKKIWNKRFGEMSGEDLEGYLGKDLEEDLGTDLRGDLDEDLEGDLGNIQKKF